MLIERNLAANINLILNCCNLAIWDIRHAQLELGYPEKNYTTKLIWAGKFVAGLTQSNRWYGYGYVTIVR